MVSTPPAMHEGEDLQTQACDCTNQRAGSHTFVDASDANQPTKKEMLGLEEKLFEMQSGTIAEWQQFAVPPSTRKLSIDVSFISKFEEPSKMLMQTDVGPLAHASVDAVLAHLRSIATEPKLRQRRTDEFSRDGHRSGGLCFGCSLLAAFCSRMAAPRDSNSNPRFVASCSSGNSHTRHRSDNEQQDCSERTGFAAATERYYGCYSERLGSVRISPRRLLAIAGPRRWGAMDAPQRRRSS